MPDSVAKQIYKKLIDRLSAINGTGDFINDVESRIYLQRPSYDIENEILPAVFIYRRSSGDERTDAPVQAFPEVTVVYDVVGLIKADSTAGYAIEDLLADIERSLEIENDKYLATDGGKNLLSQELRLINGQGAQSQDGKNYEAVAIGVECKFPKKYGDPNYVSK